MPVKRTIEQIDSAVTRLTWVVAVAIAAACVMLSGCAAAAVQSTPFERCMSQLEKGTTYANEQLHAADWCFSHNNGDVK
jgi:hypothetical protein